MLRLAQLEQCPLSDPEEAAINTDAILLAGDCDLAEAERLFDKISDVPAEETVVFDASEIEQMSTPCVLAIVSAINHRPDVTPPAAVIQPAQPFIDAFQELGLFKDMMKMEFRT